MRFDSKSLLLRGAMWNAGVSFIPVMIAVPSMAIIARNLRPADFNVFMLLLSFLGYMQILDLGFSKVVTKIAAKSKSDNLMHGEVKALMLVSMLIGLLCVWVVTITVDPITEVLMLEKSHEIWLTLVLGSASIPFLLVTIIVQGYFEGLLIIHSANIIKVSSASLMLVFPAVICLFTHEIIWLSFSILCSRMVVLGFSLLLLKSNNFNFSAKLRMKKKSFSFAGWLSLSNVISPIMTIGDRFYLTGVVGASATATYTLASEVLIKLLAFPAGATRILFPLYVSNEGKSLFADYLLMGVIALLIVVPINLFADQFILIWLGSQYLGGAPNYLRILSFGFFFVTLSQVPYSYIQARLGGMATALVHLFELPIYILLLIMLVRDFGIDGAAYAWSIRLIIEYFLLELVRYFSIGKYR